MTKKLPPVHPGEILTEDFLKPMDLTPYAVAALIGVPRTRIERLARQETAMTADTALRLARFFTVSPAFWMNIQMQHDLERAEDEAAGELANITPHQAVLSALEVEPLFSKAKVRVLTAEELKLLERKQAAKPAAAKKRA